MAAVCKKKFGFDKAIGVVNTARDRNTVLKMHELAQGLEVK